MSAVLEERYVSVDRLPLSELVDFNPKPDRGSIAADLAVTFVPMAAVEAGSGRMETTQTRAYGDVKKGFTYFCDGDVLFAKITPCMENGKMAVARGLRNGIGFGSTEFHVLRPRDGLDAKYLYHFVSSSSFRGEASHHMTGAVGQKRVPLTFLQQSEIPLPSIDRQRRIVAEIEKQFSRLDEAVAGLQRVKRSLRRFQVGAIDAATRGWTAVPLGTVLREPLRNGHSARATDDPNGLRVFTLTAVTQGDFSERNTKRTVADARKVADLWARAGDIYIERSNTPDLVGTARVYRGPERFAFIPDLLIRVRVNERVLPAYAELALMSEPGRRFFKSRAQGISGTMPKIDQDTVAMFPLPLPPIAEQHRIVAEVDRRLSIVREVEAEVEANLKRAQALRQAVLQRAFSGRPVGEAKAGAARPVLKLIPGTMSLTETAQIALSAEIVHRLRSAPSFGRVKHQKVFHLCEYIAQLDAVQGHYVRAAAGPLDLPMIEANERRMEALGWYAERQREAGGQHEYLMLSNAGEHTPYLTCFTVDQLATIRKLIDLMRDWKTDRCEMVSTAYAAWNDLLLFGTEPTPEAIVSEVLEKWDDKKRRFGRAEWLQQVAWIEEQGFEPSGFGRSTRGRADGLTPDLFRSAPC